MLTVEVHVHVQMVVEWLIKQVVGEWLSGMFAVISWEAVLREYQSGSVVAPLECRYSDLSTHRAPPPGAKVHAVRYFYYIY